MLFWLPSHICDKEKPPPCNFYYLSNCKQEHRCKYGHDYDLSEADMLHMRANAKKSPCFQANNGKILQYGVLSLNWLLLQTDKPCHEGDRCPLGHSCPYGPKCLFYEQGKCKFQGSEYIFIVVVISFNLWKLINVYQRTCTTGHLWAPVRKESNVSIRKLSAAIQILNGRTTAMCSLHPRRRCWAELGRRDLQMTSYHIFMRIHLTVSITPFVKPTILHNSSRC